MFTSPEVRKAFRLKAGVVRFLFGFIAWLLLAAAQSPDRQPLNVKPVNSLASEWLVFDAGTKTLWDVEHGPRGGDEHNKVEKGKNYGWPVITYGINYEGTPITDKTAQEGMEQPVTYWVPSIAPCGMAQVKGDKYEGWKNNLLVGAQHVARVELSDGKYVKQEKLLDKMARVRAVEQSPDGYIYIATEGPGMLLKLIPLEDGKTTEAKKKRAGGN